MEQNRIWLSPPDIDRKEHLSVEQALKSNWLAPMGPSLEVFEENLTKVSQTKYAVALNSGTSALHIGLKLLGVSKGDLVIVPANTFIAPLHSLSYLGATPILVDVDKDTWNMDIQCLKDAISDLTNKGEIHKVKAIIPVHLYGMPTEMKALVEISERYQIPILEDSAEALGSTYYGQPLGSIGDYGVFSFNGNKIITTSGGGALCSNNEKGIKRAKMLSNQARAQGDIYEHLELGYNYRLSNVLAAIGNAQLSKLPEKIEKRRRNFIAYNDYFESKRNLGYDVKMQLEPKGFFSNRWLSCISINPKNNKGLEARELKEALAKSNIESRPLNNPMNNQPLYKDAPFYSNGVSEYLYQTGLALPSGSSLNKSDFERIFKVMDELFV